MNTRWLTHYVRFRQQLALEPVRYNFAATSHDPLAQSRGVYTFHFDADRNVWQTLGTHEIGCPTFVRALEVKPAPGPSEPEVETDVYQTGIELLKPLEFVVAPILRKGSRGRTARGSSHVPAGLYRLNLLMLAPHDKVSSECVVDVSFAASARREGLMRFASIQAAHLRILCRGNSANKWNSICEVRCAALRRDESGTTASGHETGYEPAQAADGDPATRWAIEGPGHWIQFALDPEQQFDEIAIDWYHGDRRTYDFDVLISGDARRWTKLAAKTAEPRVTTDRIDIGALPAGKDRSVTRTYEVRLEVPGVVRLELTPIAGEVRVCGLTLEPVSPESAVSTDRRQ
jgi:hypothetical protein